MILCLSHFGSVMWTDTQTNADQCYTPMILIGVGNDLSNVVL